MDTKERRQPAEKRRPPTKSGRKPAANKAPARKRRSSVKKPSAEVVYTQPGPFSRNRFLLHLLSVIAVVLALLFGMSIFFKVDTVCVAGTSKYTAHDVERASGIRNGENLLTIRKARISSNIQSKLPYVDTVRVGIKLPDTVLIEVKELEVVYAAEVSDGSWMLIRSDGRAVESVTAADAERYTRVLGVVLEPTEIGNEVRAVQPVAETTPEGNTIPVTADSAAQLDAAISILQYLEENGIIGSAASVNVTNLTDLEVWYGDRFQIKLGDTTQLSYKIKLAGVAIEKHMTSYGSGILDVSLTIQPDPEKKYEVIYTPFE